MKPIEFKEQNTVFAKDQKPYSPLPAHLGDNGQAISCWRPTLGERIAILFTGRIWLSMLTFGKPLQPVKLEVRHPFDDSWAARTGLSLGAIALEVDDVAALPEFQRAWYEQDATTKKFKLNASKVEVEDVAGLKTALAKEREAVKTTRTEAERKLADALRPFEGIDPEEMKGIMSKFASEEERRLIKEGKIEDVIEKRMAKHTEAQQKLIEDAAKREAGAMEVAETFMERVLDNEVSTAALKMKDFHPSAIDDALLHARNIFSIDDDGHAVQLDADTEEPVLGKDGKTPFSPAEWLEGMREKKPHWFIAGSSGGGAGGGKHLGGKPDLSGLSPTARLTAARAAQSK